MVKAQDLFVEGESKKLLKGDQEDQLVMEFLDTVPTDAKKKLTVRGKKLINTKISGYFFEYLLSYNVPTHYIKKIDDKSLLVKKLQMIPVELIIWNIATNGLSKRLGLVDGTTLESPVLEFYLKNEKLKNPLINEYHAYALGLCDRNDMSAILRIATKTNAVLRSFFQRKNLILVNFKLEFGKLGGQIILGDEITPDTFTVWGQIEENKIDKKGFVIIPENAKEVYSKIEAILLQ